MFKGDSGSVIADFNRRLIIPEGNDADLTYLNRRSEADLIPDIGDFQKQWISACKYGDPAETACTSSIAYLTRRFGRGARTPSSVSRFRPI